MITQVSGPMPVLPTRQQPDAGRLMRVGGGKAGGGAVGHNLRSSGARSTLTRALSSPAPHHFQDAKSKP